MNTESPLNTATPQDPELVQNNIIFEIKNELEKTMGAGQSGEVLLKIQNHVFENSFTSSTEALNDFVKNENFQGLSEDAKKAVNATSQSLQNAEDVKNGVVTPESSDPQAAAKKDANAAPAPEPKAAVKDEKEPAADPEAAAGKKKFTAEEVEAFLQNRAKQEAQQEQSQQYRQPITAGSALLGMVANAFKKKEADPGASFTALQEGGFGLGMNNANNEPSAKSNEASKRMAERCNEVCSLNASADPRAIEKAQKNFLEAGEDDMRYRASNARNMMSKVAEGKMSEFEAKDAIDAADKKFASLMGKASTSAVAEFDPEFKADIKKQAEKSAEQIKELLEAITKMVKKLFGQGNDNDDENDQDAGPKEKAPKMQAPKL